ncbi:MAG: non-canonical purine NTP diphosphatase [Bacteroidales bacterium]|nr:non-canonical purine NTP diphosphatase [Bacteroidales bacterium]MDD3736901.1 non-canonical purine NTP diphosphatase [Bacteroidales bacterium]NLD63133.1 non-canonical purine NTP diphosphatase [Bacteroidales bacterium]HNT93083.1 non-canonical purine NTP diphosphatase [Bacteroidales bacterium]HOO66030.1 non-canonical purine NTP diphosphatase [Bacteroidales bacterium]
MHKMILVFATNNKHKIREISDLLGDDVKILGLSDFNITGDIPEEAETLEENALYKARYVHDRTGMNVFADDTGLEVTALGGAPGVYSARYAGESKSFDDNIDKLLAELQGKEDRSARFRTVIALILDGKEYLFEGIIEGEIISERRGDGGFGYDPVFIARGYDRTFAEIPLREKNSISHRARAMRQLITFLDEQSRGAE